MAGDTAFVTYRHGEHRFELALPKGWPVDDEAAGCALVCTEPPPVGGPPTYLPPSIVVALDEMAGGEPISTWLQWFRASLAQTYHTLRLIDLEDTVLGGVAASRSLSHYVHGVVGGVCTEQWCIPAPGGVYAVTCSSGALEYDKFADTFQRVAAGFRLWRVD